MHIPGIIRPWYKFSITSAVAHSMIILINTEYQYSMPKFECQKYNVHTAIFAVTETETVFNSDII